MYVLLLSTMFLSPYFDKQTKKYFLIVKAENSFQELLILIMLEVTIIKSEPSINSFPKFCFNDFIFFLLMTPFGYIQSV